MNTHQQYPTSRQQSRAEWGTVQVHWGRENFRLALPPPDSPLSVLKTSISQHTGVPVNEFALSTSGILLRNENATLSACNLAVDPPPQPSGNTPFSSLFRGFGWNSSSYSPFSDQRRASGSSNSREKSVLMITAAPAHVSDEQRQPATSSNPTSNNAHNKTKNGSSKSPSPSPKPTPSTKPKKAVPQTEEEMIKDLQRIFGSCLKDAIPTLELIDSGDTSSKTLLSLEGLSEHLFHELLKLDAVDGLKSEWAAAKQCRKDGVKKLQAAIAKVDGEVEKRKEKSSNTST